jgi:hypothetical protein
MPSDSLFCLLSIHFHIYLFINTWPILIKLGTCKRNFKMTMPHQREDNHKKAKFWCGNLRNFLIMNQSNFVKIILSEEDSMLFIWRTSPFSRGDKKGKNRMWVHVFKNLKTHCYRKSEICMIASWWLFRFVKSCPCQTFHIFDFFYRTAGPISTNLPQIILGGKGFKFDQKRGDNQSHHLGPFLRKNNLECITKN